MENNSSLLCGFFTWDLSLRFGFIVNNLCYLCDLSFCNICLFHPWTTRGCPWFLDPPGIKPWILQLAFTLLYLTQPSFWTHLSLITFLHFMLWSIWATPCPSWTSPNHVPKLSLQHRILCLLTLVYGKLCSSSKNGLIFLPSLIQLLPGLSPDKAWSVCFYLICSLVCNVLLLVYLCLFELNCNFGVR